MEVYVNESTADQFSPEWKKPKAYRLHIFITRDEEGTYSAVARNLPGAGSCGDTAEEALENAKEAIRGVLESYESAGKDIPWKDTSGERLTLDTIQKWIIVHV